MKATLDYLVFDLSTCVLIEVNSYVNNCKAGLVIVKNDLISNLNFITIRPFIMHLISKLHCYKPFRDIQNIRNVRNHFIFVYIFIVRYHIIMYVIKIIVERFGLFLLEQSYKTLPSFSIFVLNDTRHRCR